MRVFQNKTVVGGICIALAAVMAFFVLPSINARKGETIRVIKPNTTIYAGTLITEDMLEEKEIGSFGLPDSVIKEKTEVIGKYASCNITPDEYILTSKLSEFATDQRLDEIIANGQVLVTVSVESIAAGVGNHLKSGDIISVIGYSNNAVSTYPELQNLEIYSIENADAEDLEEVENTDDAKKTASSVTLIANHEQAEKLVLAEYSGKLHIVFVKRGAR